MVACSLRFPDQFLFGLRFLCPSSVLLWIDSLSWASSQCQPVSVGSPLWLVSGGLGSGLVQPLQTFFISGPCSHLLLKKAKPYLVFIVVAYCPALLRSVGHPVAAPWLFYTEANSTRVMWLLVVFLHPVASGLSPVLCKYCSCVFVCYLPVLCFYWGNWEDSQTVLPLTPPSTQNPLLLPLYWYCQWTFCKFSHTLGWIFLLVFFFKPLSMALIF